MPDTSKPISREEIKAHLSGIETRLAAAGGGVMYIDAFELERLCLAALATNDAQVQDIKGEAEAALIQDLIGAAPQGFRSWLENFASEAGIQPKPASPR